MKNAIIDDGYTQEAFIDAVPGVHGTLKFTYRPMLPEEVEELAYRVNKFASEPRKSTACICKAIEDHLESWDAKDSNGADVEPTLNNIRRLRYPLLGAVRYIIEGLRAGDVPRDGDSDEEESDEYIDNLMAEVDGENPVAEAEKNSDEG